MTYFNPFPFFSSFPTKVRAAIETYHREVGALTEKAERLLILEVQIRCEHDTKRLIVYSKPCEVNGRPGQSWDGSWACLDCGVVLPRDRRWEYQDPAVRRRAAAEVIAAGLG
jgi:hypothetical protein